MIILRRRILVLICGLFILLTGFFPANLTVFLPDYIKTTMKKAVDWQLKHPKHKSTDWTNGAFYSGVFAAYEPTKSKEILDSLMAIGERTGWQPGSRYDHADDTAICQTYINLYRLKKDRRMIQATIDTVQKMSRVPGREVKNHPSRNWYVTLYKQMSERLISLQQADGLWRSSLLDPEAFPGVEGSGSGFDCYALAWGINQGILDKKTYLPAVQKVWVALNTLVSPEGRMGWVQPIGADPRRNFNPDSWEVYGTGAYLLAGSEVIKLPKK